MGKNQVVPRPPWTPLLGDYGSNNSVVDREPLFYYREPEDIRFQRDIPQASSSSRRQCKYDLIVTLMSNDNTNFAY